ncbi:DUF4288 domain-containing protein [Clostridium estertheticum]|uniref:DUF4288 domain-containing protein n=1 Tax=Clostridium estertheticum TaxID=238834 RepID=UPI0013E97340|nr:DUF4288 domain-containing protein [Clostridium estertheticum]MBZ9685955.1 DUF4288 domain-containing protein [Clostridium estertheticum]
MKKNSVSKWQWFSVKLIFENVISGEPEPDTIDNNYTNNNKTYEESIVLIKAQSFDHAYKSAEKKAREMEMDYTNPYGELINHKFIEAIDCFSIIDELSTGVEMYSRFLRVPKSVDTGDFIDRYYPDTIEDNSGLDCNFVLRNRNFNKKPNFDD